MNFILGLNEKLGMFISKRVRGALGILIHGILIAIIIALITYGVYWLIQLLLTSLTWLLPIVLIIIAVAIVIYFLANVDHLYR